MLLVLIKKLIGKKKTRTPQTEPSEIEQHIEKIQKGDELLLHQVLTDYQPFIAKVTSQFSKRYIDPMHDDEFSIALSAFHEAIEKFNAQSGTSFFSFAETVIRRRLIDYVRKEQRHTKQIPYSSFDFVDDEEQSVNPIELKQAIDHYDEEQHSIARRGEILELHQVLEAFGITFAELSSHSPKHADSRATLLKIGILLGSDAEMMELLHAKKLLPIKQLLEEVNVSRKTLERNRKYLIAIALIHSGAFPYLQEYIQIDTKQIVGKGVEMHA